jgi:hypothetical protein
MNHQFLAPTLNLDPYGGPDSPFVVEISDVATGELIDFAPVRATESEHAAFAKEVQRIEMLRTRDHDFEPVRIALINGDEEVYWKEVSR